MDSAAKKQKIEQLKKGLNVAGKVAGKIGKKILKLSTKTAIKTAKLTRKEAQKLYTEYKALNKESKTNLHCKLMVAGGIFGLTGTFYTSRFAAPETPEPIMENTNARNDSIKAALTKTYKITDEESFKQLFEAALPLIHSSMLPTEIYKKSAYDDRGGANPNSIAVGLFWFPNDGKPTSSEWILASKYFKLHPDLDVSYEDAMKFTEGWYRYRENGRVYKQMFKRLKDTELNIHQFVACATCTYNNEQSGFAFCDYIKKHYKEPVKCAHYLLTLDPKDPNCVDGILKRHTSEACMYMYPEYAMQVYSFKMKNITYTNKKGEIKHHTVTSVNQINPADCKQVRADLAKGNTKSLDNIKNKICKYICKNGETVAEFINRNVKNENILASLMCYNNNSAARTADFSEKSAELTYADALKEYKAGNYEEALAGFQQLRANGYDGADLRNDIAITYFNLGRYQECIEECRAVLNTGEENLYPAANFNAGKAYEALGNYERANLNYKHALISAQKNDAKDTLKNVYKNAIKRTQDFIKDTNPHPKSIAPQKKSQKTISKTSPKAQKTAKTSTKPKGNRKTPVQNKPMKRSNRGR